MEADENGIYWPFVCDHFPDIEIVWEIEDGYAGGSRPQNLELDLQDDLNMDEEEWNALSEDEQREAVSQYVQDEFNQTINWFIDSIELSES